MVSDEAFKLDIILSRLERLRAGVEVWEVFDSVRWSPVVLIFVKYSPLLILRQDDVHLPLPVFPLQYRPRLSLVVVVQLHRVGKCADQFPVSLDELHVPTPPDHVVQSELFLPSELHPQEPVPLRRGELLSVGDGHALEQFRQRDINHGGVLEVGHTAGVEEVHQGSKQTNIRDNKITTNSTRPDLLELILYFLLDNRVGHLVSRGVFMRN